MVIIKESDHIPYEPKLAIYPYLLSWVRIARTIKNNMSIFQANNGPRTHRSTYVPSGFERNTHY